MAVSAGFYGFASKMSCNFTSLIAILVQVPILGSAVLSKQTSAPSTHSLVSSQILPTVPELPLDLFNHVVLHFPRHQKISYAFCSFLISVAQDEDLPTPIVSSEMISIFQCLFLLEVMQGFLKLPECSCWSEHLSGCGHLLISKGNVIPGSTNTLSCSVAFPKVQYLCQRDAHLFLHTSGRFLLKVIALAVLSLNWNL